MNYEGSPTNQSVHVDLNYCLTDGLGNSRLQPDHDTITWVFTQLESTWAIPILRFVPHTVPARSHERSGTDRKFSFSVRKVTSLSASSQGNLEFLHKVAQCQLLTGSYFFIIRFELWIPMYPQDGINLSHCAINNNSGPGINSPTSHQTHRPRPTPDRRLTAESRAGHGRWAESSWAEPNVVGQRFHPIQSVGGCSLHPGNKSS